MLAGTQGQLVRDCHSAMGARAADRLLRESTEICLKAARSHPGCRQKPSGRQMAGRTELKVVRFFELKRETRMNLKWKPYLEDRKKSAEGKLAARLSFLKAKGLDESSIQREPLHRKLKAEIREANHRLAIIAAQEKLNADKVRAKAEKLAAAKAEPEPPAKEVAPKAAGKKAKKEKKASE
jgi:hypothetical protein